MIETPSQRFWHLWHEREAKAKQAADTARPRIPRDGIPDAAALARYATAVAKAEAWEEVRIFLLNMAETSPGRHTRYTVGALSTEEEVKLSCPVTN